MDLNLSDRQIAGELGLAVLDVQAMTEYLRSGLIAKASPIQLEGEVEVYVVAGHKCQPAAVAKRGGSDGATPGISARPCGGCGSVEIDPLPAMARQSDHQSLDERFASASSALSVPTLVATMAHRLKTSEGEKLCALRKKASEPIFGIIKTILGSRQSLLHGTDHVRSACSLVTMAWIVKRMFVRTGAT